MYSDIVSTVIGADGQQITETVTKAATSPEVEKETEASAAEDKESAEVVEETTEAEEQESTEAEGDSEGEEQPSKRKKTGFEKRIEKLNKKATAAELRAAELEAKIAELTAKVEPKQAEPQAPAATEPQLADFDSFADYQKALFKHMREQERAEEAKAAQAQANQQKAQAFGKLIEESKAFGMSNLDDFEEVTDFSDFKHQPTPEFYEFIGDLEPEPLAKLMYRLGQDRELFKSILAMPATKAFRALTKLELEVSSPSTPAKTTEVKVTKAPKPPSTVSGIRGSKVAEITDNMSTDDFRKARMAQLKSRK